MQLTLTTWGVADDADKACTCLVTLSAMYAPAHMNVDERHNSHQQSNHASMQLSPIE